MLKSNESWNRFAISVKNLSFSMADTKRFAKQKKTTTNFQNGTYTTKLELIKWNLQNGTYCIMFIPNGITALAIKVCPVFSIFNGDLQQCEILIFKMKWIIDDIVISIYVFALQGVLQGWQGLINIQIIFLEEDYELVCFYLLII